MLAIHAKPCQRLDVSIQIGKRMLAMEVPNAEMTKQPVVSAGRLKAEVTDGLVEMLLVFAESPFLNHFNLLNW